jgi:hypothetical protein
VLTYRATIPLSTRSLTHLAGLLRHHRTRRGTRYRRLDVAGQALLVLAHLRNGDTVPWRAMTRKLTRTRSRTARGTP